MNGFWHDMDCCHELDVLFGNGLLSGNWMNASQGSTPLYYLRVNRAVSYVAKSHRLKRMPVLHLLHPIIVLSQTHVKLLNPAPSAPHPILESSWHRLISILYLCTASEEIQMPTYLTWNSLTHLPLLTPHVEDTPILQPSDFVHHRTFPGLSSSAVLVDHACQSKVPSTKF